MPEFILLDLETTGLDLDQSEIIEIGAILVSDMKIIDSFSCFVKSKSSVSPEITALTGITDEMVRSGDEPIDAIKKLKRFACDRPIVAHNGLGFDLYFLKRYGFEPDHIYDLMDLSYFVLPLNESHSVAKLAMQFNLGKERHRALDDCHLELEIIKKLLIEFSLKPKKVKANLKYLANSYKWWWNPFLNSPESEFSSFLDVVDAHKGYRKKNPNQEAFLGGVQTIDPSEVAKYFESSVNKDTEYQEERPGQKSMAVLLAEIMNTKKHAVIEAGTGIGKSKAYLVPGALFSQKNCLPLVVSTHTKVLQDQLFTKEIPHIKNLINSDLRIALLKGKQNYVCLTKVDELYHSLSGRALNQQKNFDMTVKGVRYDRILSFLLLASWVLTTNRGDWDEIPYWLKSRFSKSFEDDVRNIDESCAKGVCEGFDDHKCFLSKAKLRARDADIVIVNHALLLSGIVESNLTDDEGNTTTTYSHTMLSKESQFIIIDEAHFLEDDATSSWEIDISRNAFEFYTNLVFGKRSIVNHLEYIMTRSSLSDNEEFFSLVNDLKSLGQQTVLFGELFNNVELISFVGNSGGKYVTEKVIDENVIATQIWLQNEKKLNDMFHLFSNTAKLLSKVAKLMKEHLDQDREIGRIEKRAEMIERFALSIEKFLKTNNNFVRFFSLEKDMISFKASPISVADLLKKNVFDNFESVSLVSASLAVDQSFDFVDRRYGLGLIKPEKLIHRIFESSFDYSKQMRFFITKGISYSNDQLEDFYGAALPFLLDAITASRGGSLILCSSHEQIDLVSNYLKEELTEQNFVVLRQDRHHSANSVIRSFKEDINSVLVGTESLWHGVDVPGVSLRSLFILKIPYKNPSTPVIQARKKAVSDSGRNGFLEYYQPLACMTMKQGIGRLIRKSTDTGIAVLLDDRIFYKPQILNSLPRGMNPIRLDPSDICQELKKLSEGADESGSVYSTSSDNTSREKSYTIDKIHQNYSQAYEPWTIEEDNLLLSSADAGKTKEELAILFGRDSNAVDSHLKKLIHSDNIENLPDNVKLIFNKLKIIRSGIAKQKKFPAFCICNDSVLVQIATNLPQNKGDLLKIKGIGNKFVDQYGDQFINVDS